MSEEKPHTARLSKESLKKMTEKDKNNNDENNENNESQTKKLDSDRLLKQYAMEVPDPITPEKGIALYLPNQSEPMVITDKKNITLGRRDPSSNTNPVLDLTEYYGAELGVSRFHGEISISDGGYYIKDMGSTNGTYVNGNKVPPYKLTQIRRGDQIRLGHLSIVIG